MASLASLPELSERARLSRASAWRRSSRASSSRTSPASVSWALRRERSNSSTFRSASSKLMAVLTADCALPSMRAAALKEPHSAVVTNWRSCSRVQFMASAGFRRCVCGRGPDVQWNGDWPVIDQRDLHIGTKFAACHFGMQRPRLLHEVIAHCLTVLGWRGGSETRPIAFVSVGSQGELAHDQQAAAYVLNTAVHPAVFVGKDAQLEYFLQQDVCLCMCIGRLGAEQNQQAGADAANELALYGHARLRNALQNAQHGIET